MDTSQQFDLIEEMRIQRSIVYLKEAFKLKGRVKYSTVNEQYYFAGSGNPVGQHIIQKILKNPKEINEILLTAWKKYNQYSSELENIKTVALDNKIPIKSLIILVFKYLNKANGTALDRIFDYVSFTDALKKYLKKYDDEISVCIQQIMTPANGIDCELVAIKNTLLYLAHEFSKNSLNPAAFAFVEFTQDWYQQNYVSNAIKLHVIEITIEKQKSDLAKLMKKENIIDGNFDSVLVALKKIQHESMERRNKRECALEKIISYSKQFAVEKVKALLLFAGDAISMNEEMHLTNEKALNLLKIGAEKRSIAPKELIQLVFEVSCKPQETT